MFEIYTEKVLIYSNPRIHKFDKSIQKGLAGENNSQNIIKALKKLNSISFLRGILQKDIYQYWIAKTNPPATLLCISSSHRLTHNLGMYGPAQTPSSTQQDIGIFSKDTSLP